MVVRCVCIQLPSSACRLIGSIVLAFAVATEEDNCNSAITGALWTCCAVHTVHHVGAVCTPSHSCSSNRESAIHVGSIHLDTDDLFGRVPQTDRFTFRSHHYWTAALYSPSVSLRTRVQYL